MEVPPLPAPVGRWALLERPAGRWALLVSRLLSVIAMTARRGQVRPVAPRLAPLAGLRAPPSVPPGAAAVAVLSELTQTAKMRYITSKWTRLVWRFWRLWHCDRSLWMALQAAERGFQYLIIGELAGAQPASSSSTDRQNPPWWELRGSSNRDDDSPEDLRRRQEGFRRVMGEIVEGVALARWEVMALLCDLVGQSN